MRTILQVLRRPWHAKRWLVAGQSPSGCWHETLTHSSGTRGASGEKGAKSMELKVVPIQPADGVNLILGQSHFIKTVEDVHEALVGAVPSLQFGLAFCEASRLPPARWGGTHTELIDL